MSEALDKTDPNIGARGKISPQVRDTGPLSSKKFLAYLIAEISSKFLLASGLWIIKNDVGTASVPLWGWMTTLTVCTVFLEVGTILGIAYVDRFTRVAALATGAKIQTE